MISTADRNAMRRLAELYGVQRSYKGMGDRRVTASSDATFAVLAALGAETANGNSRNSLMLEEEKRWQHPLEPVVVAWDGELKNVALRLPAGAARKAIDYEIELEDGVIRSGSIPLANRSAVREKTIARAKYLAITFSIEDALPIGYHELRVTFAGGEARATIFSAPMRCYPGAVRRTWGVFAPLYALRTNRHKPIGDFSDLEQLLTWVSGHGGNIAATLPISAAFLTAPFDPSPYSPASRLYWNELFIDLDRMLANTDSVPARNRAGAADWQHALHAAAAGDYVEYREIAHLKRHVLEALADWFYLQQRQESADFKQFVELYPDVHAYAQFRAAGERQARGWPAWPPRLRAGHLEAQDYDDDAARYHVYAQFAVHQQLQALADRSRVEQTALYLDMPLGVHADSFDVWRMPHLFVTGASAGAPPDAFFTKGQNWGFPPLNPKALREERYEYLRRVLRTQLRYAGMLRIDHVMSLHRLFFVPSGYDATDGLYVRYPEDELYAVLTIESQRHSSAVVGEDLGTVPAEVRKAMKRHGVKRMFVVQFEAAESDPPISSAPAEAVASLNTHDMPPFAAYWHAMDAELRREMGLLTPAEADNQHEHRDNLARALAAHLRRTGSLDGGAFDRVLHRKPEAGDALMGLLDWLARSPAEIVLINLEDLWLEEQPQNVPGTSTEKPNWRRRMQYTLDDLRASNQVAAMLQHVNAARHAQKGSSTP